MPHVPSSPGQYPTQGYAIGEFGHETDTGDDYEGDRYTGGGYQVESYTGGGDRREHHAGRRVDPEGIRTRLARLSESEHLTEMEGHEPAHNFDPHEESEWEPDYEGIMQARGEARAERRMEYWDRKF